MMSDMKPRKFRHCISRVFIDGDACITDGVITEVDGNQVTFQTYPDCGDPVKMFTVHEMLSYIRSE